MLMLMLMLMQMLKLFLYPPLYAPLGGVICLLRKRDMRPAVAGNVVALPQRDMLASQA